MFRGDQDLPSGWDPAFEKLISSPIVRGQNFSNIAWSDRNLNNLDDAPSSSLVDFLRAQPAVDESVTAPVDPSKVRSNRINHLINMPLSPRKPIVIPGSNPIVRQRDKQKIEKIIKQRKRISNMEVFKMINDVRESAPITRNVSRPVPLSLRGRYNSSLARHKSFFD